MPLEVRQTSAAREDLIGIWLYIDNHSPSGASRILQRIKEVSQRLAEYPEMGRAMLEIDGSLRVFPV